MKITSQILHLPPYITTTWIQLNALYVKNEELIVILFNDETIAIPGIPPETREQILNAYAAFLEEKHRREELADKTFGLEPYSSMQMFQVSENPGSGISEPKHMPIMRMNFDSIESIAESLQHDNLHANIPDIPAEVLNKIAQVARIVAGAEIDLLPKPEPHCNCPHCQIAKAIHNYDPAHIDSHADSPLKEEIITDKDLEFQQWEIRPAGERLYSVTNRLDPIESYNVHLGEPVGCTCGNTGCEHILAVLKS